MLAASETPPIDEVSSRSLRYSDEFRLTAGVVPGGSLNGDPSTGLVGELPVSANGFRSSCCERAGLVGVASLPAAAPYGCGAVALDADRLIPAAAPAAPAPAMTAPMLGG